MVKLATTQNDSSIQLIWDVKVTRTYENEQFVVDDLST